VLLFEMGTGKLPFEHENTNELFEQIINKALDFGEAELSSDFKDLIDGVFKIYNILKILNKNPEKRLGSK
jgi:hypothetical protein